MGISVKMKELTANSSTIRAMFEEGRRLSAINGAENVYDFSLGNPSIAPPEHVRDEAIKILESENPLKVHGYMNNSGYEDVREAIAHHLNYQHEKYFTKENLIMTCGAAGGLNILLKTLLNPGDEVIVLAPFFGEYAHYVANFDGVLVIAQTEQDTFQPDLSALEKVITSKTKVIIINTPNNPTGAVYSAESLAKMAELLKIKEKEFLTSIYVISDEPYREIVYDGEKVPFTLDYFRNGFIGYSYSKSLSLPGERIGYVLANGEMDDFTQVMQALNVANRILGFVNAPSLFQRVIANSLNVKSDVKMYETNRDVLYKHLTSLGISCNKPKGAFYLFPKTPIQNDKLFSEEAKKYNILLVPGSSFYAPGYVRIAYCVNPKIVESSLDAFTKLMANFVR